MKRYFNKIYYRNANAVVTSLTKGGTYPDYTFTGFTSLVGGQAGATVSIEGDGEEPCEGGTTVYTSGEKAPLEITVNNFTAAEYATIRNAFLNVKVDIMLFDSDQPTVGYAVFGTRVHPSLKLVGGEEPKIVISGDRKFGSGLTTPPFQLVAIT